MSIFRLIRGEMQKILLRPFMYIITIALVLALFGSVALFQMTDRQTLGYTISGSTKSEVYTNFLSNTSINKNIADKKIDTALGLVDTYSAINATPSTSVTAKIKSLLNSATGELVVYQNNIQSISSNETDLSTVEQSRQNLITISEQIQSTFVDAVQGDILSILITKNSFDTFVGLITQANNFLNSAIDTNNLDDHKLILNNLTNVIGYKSIEGKNYFNKLTTLANQQFTDIVVKEEIISSLKLQYDTAKEYMNTIDSKITEELNDEAVNVQDFKNTVLSYYYTALQYEQLVKDSIKYYPVENYQDTTINSFIGYKDINSYELHQEITRNDYLISHNMTDNLTGSVFSPTTSFGNQVSALDLVYFGLEICGLIIIIISIVLVAQSIAGESGRGTLRLQAIRPYSRCQILSSKIAASVLFGTILLIFSAIVLFIAGWIMFGIDTTSILVVFNASTPFVISPFALIFIYIALLIFKIFFYIMFATLISTLFRNNIAGILIPLVFYIVNAVFSFLFVTTAWYAFIPFSCIDLFKFFGGSFIMADNPLSIALSSPIFYNTNFIYSICMSVALCILMIIFSHIAFKKRDIR